MNENTMPSLAFRVFAAVVCVCVWLLMLLLFRLLMSELPNINPTENTAANESNQPRD